MNSIYANIDDLYLFCKVIEEGSLLKASQKLELPVSTMSRRLSTLEDRLNVRLLKKQGRELVATEAGEQTYHSFCSSMEQLEISYDELLHNRSEVYGNFRIFMPHNFYRLYTADIIKKLLEENPKINFELCISEKNSVPQTNHDLMIAFDISNMQEMIARPLFQVPEGIYASEAYIDKHGLPETIDGLLNHNWVCTNRSETKINLIKDNKPFKSIVIDPRVYTYDVSLNLDCAEKGMGISVLPIPLAQITPSLTRIFPQYSQNGPQVYLVYKERKYQPKAMRLLINALIEGSDAMIESMDDIIEEYRRAFR